MYTELKFANVAPGEDETPAAIENDGRQTDGGPKICDECGDACIIQAHSTPGEGAYSSGRHRCDGCGTTSAEPRWWCCDCTTDWCSSCHPFPPNAEAEAEAAVPAAPAADNVAPCAEVDVSVRLAALRLTRQLLEGGTASATRGVLQVREHSYLRSSASPTLPSPQPCCGPLTVGHARRAAGAAGGVRRGAAARPALGARAGRPAGAAAAERGVRRARRLVSDEAASGSLRRKGGRGRGQGRSFLSLFSSPSRPCPLPDSLRWQRSPGDAGL